MNATYLDNLMAGTGRICIVSGEGEVGSDEDFTGRRTRLAITRAINRELCDGDRWAYAVIEDGNHAVSWGGGGGDIDQCDYPD